MFGSDICVQFCHRNNVKMMARAHQLVMEGFKFMFDEKLVTVWSAPNYCYRCGNIAAILTFEENMESKPKFFTETEQNSTMVAPRQAVPYFL